MNTQDVGEALKRLLDMKETYKIVLFTDGSGHADMMENDNRGISWDTWDELENVAIFKIKDDVEINTGLHEGESGIVVADRGDGYYRVWVECNTVVTLHHKDLTAK